ncbi:hypothetical protein E3P81_01231 [Wallemia ichthyophaga]|nr:hypothetical protein E3P91_00925 [Wallemia ichthyophaga]TIA92855.1 hypothetical protein E3P97_01232 [Wallemia ichthyophaga]TIB34212.1 hypothetical protein E3P85_00981 [Wallemia ichthyophaga]TIB48480.1 hypothetical protein E3P82_01230 [Wallemia ichthyophaga]TIB52640.1 hypothetical protein E3P81_01231 [Wallemia ichthyophaga]
MNKSDLFTLAHLQDSQLHWDTRSDCTVHRKLGLVEMFFHKMSTLHQGRTDIFFKLPMSLSNPDILFNALPAWSKLHQLHPSLSLTVQEGENLHFVLNTDNLSSDPLTTLIHSSHSLIYQHDVDVDTWMRNYLWNGPRRYLDHAHLARLFIFHNTLTNNVDLVIATAHSISDGTSVVSLMHDFLRLLTSDLLDECNVRADLPTLENFHSFTPHIHTVGDLTPLKVTKEDILSALPDATEVGYPPLPNYAPKRTTPLPRLRWYWAIRRVVSQVRSDKLDRLTTLEFVGGYSPQQQQSLQPPWGALTDWMHFSLSREQTDAVVRFAKACAVKIGPLLFAATSMAIANVNHRHKQQHTGDTCLVGFPFSLRPYLQRRTATTSNVSVQLGFGGIQLPSTPCTSDSPTFKRRFAHRAQTAQTQFVNLLTSPTLLQDAHTMALSRAAHFAQGGDGWKAVKEKGDETQQSQRGKGTAINASMLGVMNVKQLYQATDGVIMLDQSPSRSALLGVRCRSNELLLETFSLGGQLTVSLGKDGVQWGDECVREYLDEFERILKAF